MDAFFEAFYFLLGFVLVVGVGLGYLLRSGVQWLKDNPPRGE